METVLPDSQVVFADAFLCLLLLANLLRKSGNIMVPFCSFCGFRKAYMTPFCVVPCGSWFVICRLLLS